MRTIEAQHPGICPDCESTIQVGDRIVMRDGGVHERCPEGSRFDFNPDDVCPNCFVIRAVNGACSCVN